MASKLCLGTAQFGLPYGITNTSGQVSEVEVCKILLLAQQEGIRYLDTAQAYGDAESVLGRTMPKDHQFQIISKLPLQKKASFTVVDVDIWEKSFHESLERLQVSSLESLLLHCATDLRKPGGHFLRNWLVSLRKRGYVSRLGISIYTSDDLVGIPLELLDMVQLPLSIYDQRLLQDGTIFQLKNQGVAVHVRSLFLQGLLLSSSESWPGWVSLESRYHHASLEKKIEYYDCKMLDYALYFGRSLVDVEGVLLGICSASELLEALQSWNKEFPFETVDTNSWALSDLDLIDPRRWPK